MYERTFCFSNLEHSYTTDYTQSMHFYENLSLHIRTRVLSFLCTEEAVKGEARNNRQTLLPLLLRKLIRVLVARVGTNETSHTPRL